MKKVGVCGHFGIGKELLNGQTIKTKIVTDELRHQLGDEEVLIVDTHGGAKAFPRMAIQLLGMFHKCNSIIMMPAHKGVRIFTVLFSFYNLFFRRKLEYVVIGGWITNLVDEHKWLRKRLMKFDGIFVETTTMKRALETRGFTNIYVMPNFKDLKVISEDELVFDYQQPFKVCTFSRVMKEKGIEDAIQVIKDINEKMGKTVYELDIYGQVFQYDEFDELQKHFPDYVHYKGCVPFDKSVDVLKNYFALLFPTKFYTEGIPGTIIDAYAAGVPVISSRWESFEDVIDEGVTGFGYAFGDLKEFGNLLLMMMTNPNHICDKKVNCIIKAREYVPSTGISSLFNKIGMEKK